MPNCHTVAAMLLCCSIFILLPGVSPAEEAYPENELAPGFDQCMDASNFSTPDMIECVTDAYKYWDKLLNDEYKNAQKICSGKDNNDEVKACQAKLKKTQQAWIQYKENMSDLIGNVLGGGGQLDRFSADVFFAKETKKQALLLKSAIVGGEL